MSAIDRTLAFLDEALKEIDMTEYGENVYTECPDCGGQHGMDNCDASDAEG